MANLENNNENNSKLEDKTQVTSSSDKGDGKGKSSRGRGAKVLRNLFFIGLALVLLLLMVINLPITKNYAATKALDLLHKELGLDISKENIDLNFFGDVTITGLQVKDERGYAFIKAKELRAESNWFSLLSSTNNLHFQSITLVEPKVHVITYKGDSISNFIRFVEKFDNGKPRDPNKPPFRLSAGIRVLNGRVTIVNENSPGESGRWLDAKHVNLFAPMLEVVGPDVKARINNFTFITKRYGEEHYVETFSTDFHINQKVMELKNLTMNTQRSLLMGDLVFHLDEETGWKDFSNKVAWEMNLERGSVVSGADIGYFAVNWDTDAPIQVSGEMQGPLNDFDLEDFMLTSTGVKVYTQKATVAQILESEFSISTKKLLADFTYKDLKAIFPHFISEKMGDFADVFGHVKFEGDAAVNTERVQASGELITSIGQAKIKSFTLTDIASAQPKYVGDLTVKDLNTTAFTQSDVVGLLTGAVKIEGRGFNLNTLSLKTQSHFQQVQVLGKQVREVFVKGDLTRKNFKGSVAFNDFHADGKLEGTLDFSKPRIFMDMLATIENLDLNYFGYKGEANSRMGGVFKGKVSLKNLDDISLDVSLDKAWLQSGKQNLRIPASYIKSSLQSDGSRLVEVNAPNMVEGRLAGAFNLSDLTGMVTQGLKGVLGGFHPKKYYKNQNFNFNFTLQQNFVSYFLPDLHLPTGGQLEGRYQGNTNDLLLNLEAQQLWFLQKEKPQVSEADRQLAQQNPNYKIDESLVVVDSISVKNLTLNIDTSNPLDLLQLNIGEIKDRGLLVEQVEFLATKDNPEILKLAINLHAGAKTSEKERSHYAINLMQTMDQQGDIVVHFAPTKIDLGKEQWLVDTSPSLNHSVVYHVQDGDLHINNIRLFSGESSILMNGDFRSGADFNTDIEVSNLQIAKIITLFMRGEGPDIKGRANGTAKIVMNEKNLQPLIDLKVTDVTLNDYEIGDLDLVAKNGDKTNVFDVKASIGSTGILGSAAMRMEGTIDNNGAEPAVDLNAHFNDFRLAFIGGFVKSVFEDMQGKATGDLKIKGPLDNIDYSGLLAMSDFGFKLKFNGVKYHFADAVVPVSKGLIQFNGLRVYDERQNSGGSLSGILQFENFTNFGLNLLIRSDNLLLLNTSRRDFDIFWGRVAATGDLYISGPVDELSIEADASVLGGSEFTLNTNTTASVEEFKMLRFLKADETTGEVVIGKKQNSGLNLNVNLMLDVNNKSTVNVLFGEELGNISVKGFANNLRFNMNRAGVMTMNGSYKADSGTFVSKAILERTFQLQKGSNISWDGDVMNPYLDIVANYYRTVSNLGQYLNVGRLQPTTVQLQIKIQGPMERINPVMDIKLPDASSQIKEALAVKTHSEDEKIKQIGSILVLNTFNTSTSMADINFNTAISTGYNVLFKNLASVFNTISKDFQVDLDYIQGDQSAKTADRANTSFNINLSPRVKVKTGIGIPLAKGLDVRNNYLSGEGQIEYDMSTHNDGSLILRAYSKPANIGLVVGSNASENQSYGVGVVYTHSFNSFGELFGKKKDKPTENEKRKKVSDSVIIENPRQ